MKNQNKIDYEHQYCARKYLGFFFPSLFHFHKHFALFARNFLQFRKFVVVFCGFSWHFGNKVSMRCELSHTAAAALSYIYAAYRIWLPDCR